MVSNVSTELDRIDPTLQSDEERPEGWYVNPSDPEWMRYWSRSGWLGSKHTKKALVREWYERHPKALKSEPVPGRDSAAELPELVGRVSGTAHAARPSDQEEDDPLAKRVAELVGVQRAMLVQIESLCRSVGWILFLMVLPIAIGFAIGLYVGFHH